MFTLNRISSRSVPSSQESATCSWSGQAMHPVKAVVETDPPVLWSSHRLHHCEGEPIKGGGRKVDDVGYDIIGGCRRQMGPDP
jgi:hypothetical protein